ncbi:hypothetical protein DIC66_03910 [Rhodoferax lacus]|uniref:Caspase family p20 domain-containing protein n=1 Tax=Rhodoferax lacus TaxID=2184758 RepID=A0A3E1RF82_9BURK|nr:caspase family protein [Rhodoferax lacus]RFO97881.1 hypothetical protein DIC66_03910 [Rhodoferax lacus]
MDHFEQPRTWVRRAGKYALVLTGIALLSGCLAATVTSIGHFVSDTMAPNVTFFVPAKNAEAGALKSVLVVSDNFPVSQQVAMEFESQMSKLRVNERPAYTIAKLGPHFNGQPGDAQLAELAKSNGVEAVYVLTGGGSDVKTVNTQEDRMGCSAETKLFEPCPKGRETHTKVNCTTTTGSVAVRLRVYRAVDGRYVYADSIGGGSSLARCDDQNTARPDNNQLAYSAMLNASTNAMHMVAPSYELRPLDIMSADAAVPAAQKKDFDAAYEFAKVKRTDEACQRFEELYLDTKVSPALTFNVAFCNEMRGDLLRANQGYKRASELVNAPESQIDRRLAVTEKALRENPMAFVPVAAAPVGALPVAGRGLGGGKRVALVIGNGRYQRSALTNPTADARLVSDRLKRIGFDVLTLEDVPAARFEAATRDFAARAKGADIALFYYAGHALQADGENYLMPVDNAKMRTMEDVRDGGGVQLASIIARLDVAAPLVKLVVIDACRDNPLPASSRSLAGGGLAAIPRAPQGGLIAFATSPGRTAEDGTGKNSVFSKNFAALVSTPNLGIEQMFKRVREAVKKETNGRQEPMETSNLIGDVMLVQAAAK